jgi:acetyl esterase/lipase
MTALRALLMSFITTLLLGCQATVMRSLNVPYALAPVSEVSVSYGENSAHRMSIYRPTGLGREKCSSSEAVAPNKCSSSEAVAPNKCSSSEAVAPNKRSSSEAVAPNKNSASALPVLLFFYGGSWRNGERAWYRFVAKHYALKGFVVMVPDYRKAPEYIFPAFVEDAARSFAYAREQAAIHGGDSEKIIVFGHSAGAHIGALLSLDPSYLQKHRLRLSDIHGFIGIAGPYDFLPMTSESVIEVFNGDANLASSQPIHFARTLNEPVAPMLLIHGRKDWLVWPKNSANLTAELRAKGVAVTYVELPRAGHFTPLFQAGRGLNWLSPKVDAEIERFVRGLD